MSQQGIDFRLAAAKGDIGVHDVATAADLQDLGAESLRRLRVENPGLLERTESVGSENLGPLVAVVSGRVAAREDV